MNWRTIQHPPFTHDLFTEQQTAAWETLKQELSPGTVLTGIIYAQAPFGVFFNAGVGFPARMNVTDFGKPEGSMVFSDDYPALASEISGQLSGFEGRLRQLVTVKDYAKWIEQSNISVAPSKFATTIANHPLISIDPEIRFGRACLIGTRISVDDILEWLGNGRSTATILEDFPQLSEEQIRASLRYAADRLRNTRLVR